jgi:hypothetical protein
MRRRIEVVHTAIELNGEMTYGSPKTPQRRSVPIPRSLVDELARHVAGKDPEDLVFTRPAAHRGEPRRPGRRQRQSGPADAQARVRGHDAGRLRRTVRRDLDAVAERLDEAAAKARADYLRTQAVVADVVPLDLGEAYGL